MRLVFDIIEDEIPLKLVRAFRIGCISPFDKKLPSRTIFVPWIVPIENDTLLFRRLCKRY